MSLQGHLYVAFNDEYDKCACCSVKALRRFSTLPVHVVTNLKVTPRRWSSVNGVTFQYVVDKSNRDVKTEMINYSPFDETLYTDCDTVIHSKRFMEAFELLRYCDIAFPCHTDEDGARRLTHKVFIQAINDFNLELPLLIYQGGICVFKKNEACQKFFRLWHNFWMLRKFRDMPPLAAAMQKIEGVTTAILPETFGFTNSTVIQHFYGAKPPPTEWLPQFTKQWANENRMAFQPRSAFR